MGGMARRPSLVRDAIPGPTRTGPAQRRPHTGRQRNEQARADVLDAAVRLMSHLGRAPSVAELAAECHIGRQTIYRWWPSKGALMLDAFVRMADIDIGDTESLGLDGFVRVTLTTAARPERREVLRSVVAEALSDEAAMATLRSFTAARRHALREILVREAGGRLVSTQRLDVLVDEVFGVLWYRVLFDHGALDTATAHLLVDDVRRRLA